MYIVCIDVGIKNLAFIVYNTLDKQVVHWEKVVVAENYEPCRNVDYMYSFVDKYDHYFKHAHKVVIEKQMRANMRIIEAILHTIFYPVCSLVNARVIKSHFNIGMRSYRLNKKAAVDKSMELLSEPYCRISNCPDCLNKLGSQSKKDDLADCLLILVHYLDCNPQI